ncbi:MAG: hypothetical protein U0271_36445 [Polyangiaceae bacterium]
MNTPPNWGPQGPGGQPPNPYHPPAYGGPPPQQPGTDVAGLIAPVNVKNWLAFASGWMGIISLLCFGPLLGIPAVLMGVFALRRPHLGGQGRAWTGIITGAIATVVWSIALFFGSRSH